ncbi:hypothetical protein ACU8KH_04743 [Lachancea thermotolerans]
MLKFVQRRWKGCGNTQGSIELHDCGRPYGELEYITKTLSFFHRGGANHEPW